MDWYLVCLAPEKSLKIKEFPFNVGRSPDGVSSVKFDDPIMSRAQFSLNSLLGQVYYVNKSSENPATVDGLAVTGKMRLTPGVHIVKVGNTTIGIGTEYDELCAAVSAQTVEYYMARAGGRELGPWTAEQLVQACENGVLGRVSKVWFASDPMTVYSASAIVDFARAKCFWRQLTCCGHKGYNVRRNGESVEQHGDAVFGCAVGRSVIGRPGR